MFSFKMLLGCTLAMAGFAAFSHCKLAARQEKATKEDDGTALVDDLDKGALQLPG